MFGTSESKLKVSKSFENEVNNGFGFFKENIQILSFLYRFRLCDDLKIVTPTIFPFG